MRRPGKFEVLAILAFALIAGLAVSFPAANPMRGWTLDALTTLRWYAFGERRPPRASSTVVIALDEQTYAAPPFKGSPTLTWTDDIGRVVSAVIDGGARVVGFDVVFSSSLEDSQIRFGDDTLGTKLHGFDRDYLRALASGGRAGKIVLGETESGGQSILPTAGQRLAAGGRANLRSLNVHTDLDDVVRRVPLLFSTSEGDAPSMALELASRAEGVSPQLDAEGAVLAGERIKSIVEKTIAVAFSGGSNDIPTYSLADLRACLDKDDKEFFRRQFADKVVIVGSDVANADQILTSKRFADPPLPQGVERCASLAPPPAKVSQSRAMSGVFLQAMAVDNLIRRETLREAAPWKIFSISFAAAATSGIFALAFRTMVVTLGAAIVVLIWIVATTCAFQFFVVLPLLGPIASGAAAIGAAIALRLGVADREKRFLRHAFSLYLAPDVIDRMTSSGALPTLGGETREVTMFFSDVVGFSTLSEAMKPEEIVSLMNDYLTSMSEAIETAGGFVDKYVGDAIVAIFGAPVRSPDHAIEAVTAALACQRRLEAFNRERALPIQHRIGLNTGEALIGNIGSRRRFNYTAFGDSVNLASRLEQVNASFGTSILAAESIIAATGAAFVWREIDTIRVRGRATPVTVFEPLARRGEETEGQRDRAHAYAEGLQAWRARDFIHAETHFSRFVDDMPAALFRKRCRAYIDNPPGELWEPILLPPSK
jgi:class 3 adenylate cyclase/CHASE2 domain-containing sensor protein